MGFDLYTAKGELQFKATIMMMALLVQAMLESGVDLRKQSLRRFDPRANVKPAQRDLMGCFSFNSGVHVTAAEAREIAEKVGKMRPRWVAPPTVVVPKDVYMHPRKRNAAGEPTEWQDLHAHDPTRPPLQAAEIGADRRLVEKVEEFVAFCREAGEHGGQG